MAINNPDDFYAGEVRAYARSFLGVPYVYGGNTRFTGLDCSGVICAVLRKYGLVGPHEDLSAYGLYEKFKLSGLFIQKNEAFAYPFGALLFYGVDEHSISHVAMSMDFYSVFESGGGNARIDSLDKARSLGAQVHERTASLRKDLVAVILLRWPWQH